MLLTYLQPHRAPAPTLSIGSEMNTKLFQDPTMHEQRYEPGCGIVGVGGAAPPTIGSNGAGPVYVCPAGESPGTGTCTGGTETGDATPDAKT